MWLRAGSPTWTGRRSSWWWGPIRARARRWSTCGSGGRRPARAPSSSLWVPSIRSCGCRTSSCPRRRATWPTGWRPSPKAWQAAGKACRPGWPRSSTSGRACWSPSGTAGRRRPAGPWPRSSRPGRPRGGKPGCWWWSIRPTAGGRTPRACGPTSCPAAGWRPVPRPAGRRGRRPSRRVRGRPPRPRRSTRLAADPEARRQAGLAPEPAAPGLSTQAMLEHAVAGRLGFLYLVGANLVETFPDRALATAALESEAFVVVQDLFLTETARLADVVLPAAPFTARAGHLTNLEGRVQATGPRSTDPAAGLPVEAWTDGQIFEHLGEALQGRPLVAGAGELATALAAAGLGSGTFAGALPVALLHEASDGSPTPSGRSEERR